MPLVRKGSGGPPATPASPDALGALTRGTHDERWAAARAAVDIPGAAQALGAALANEADARVREAMLTSLGRIASAESMEVLMRLLRSDDAQVRTGALDALRTLKGGLGPSLPSLLHDADPDVRLLACELVRDLPGEEPARLLCGVLESELHPNVCAAAVEVLAEIGGRDALPVLARCQERFSGTPFLAFSIKVAADRIRSQSESPRA